MAYMIVYILDDTSQMPGVLRAWEDAGAPGITVLNSTGLNRLKRAGFREDVPLIPSMIDVMEDETLEHRTLIMIVHDEAQVERFVEAARSVVGDFEAPHTGILCVLPLAQVHGLGRAASRSGD